MGEGLYRKYKYKHKYNLARLLLFYTQLQIVFRGLHTIETFWVQFRITGKLRELNSNKYKSMGICIFWTERTENLLFYVFILCFKIKDVCWPQRISFKKIANWKYKTAFDVLHPMFTFWLVWFYSFLPAWLGLAGSIHLNQSPLHLPPAIPGRLERKNYIFLGKIPLAWAYIIEKYYTKKEIPTYITS